MSRKYNLGTFLRQTPRASLESYFESRGLLQDFDFFDLHRNNIGPALRAVMSLPPHQRNEVETDFRDIFPLADQAGTQIMIEHLSQVEPRLVDSLRCMENHYERAMWLFMCRNRSADDLFRQCRLSVDMRTLSFPRSKRLVGLPAKNPAHDEATCQALAAGLSAWYREQGRGERCLVEYHHRSNPERHCFFAYANDYSGALLTMADEGLTRQSVRPVFEICFVFYSDEGVLEMAAPGRAKEVAALQDLFCRTTLGLSGRPTGKGRVAYRLNGLLNPSFSFATDPEDGIERVELLAVELMDRESPRHRVWLMKPAGSTDTLDDLIARFCSGKGLSRESVAIRQVRLRLTFRGDGQSKRKSTKTFMVSSPDGTSLKDGPRDQIARKYLKRWNIAA
jgi:hypothetical protein